jgi:MOSC domain-containing protein YiiM
MSGKKVKFTAKVLGVCISDRKGIAKTPVDSITLIENYGVEGDAHAGTEKRQVSLIGIETHQKLINRGINVEIGDFAENICTEGVVLYELPVGTKMEVNDVELELTQIGKKCHTGCAIKQQVGDCPMPREGVFVKVIKGGVIRKNDIIEIF